jgi:hypothetical protein
MPYCPVHGPVEPGSGHAAREVCPQLGCSELLEAPTPPERPTAGGVLREAADLIDRRGAERDQPGGERSMAAAVSAFNSLFGRQLTETEGWEFMSLLKKARKAHGAYQADDYHDDVAYCALSAESAAPAPGPTCRLCNDFKTVPLDTAPGDAPCPRCQDSTEGAE